MMHRRAALGMALILAAIAVSVDAEQAAAPTAAAVPAPAAAKAPVLNVSLLKGSVYWVSGGASNTGFVVGNKGVVVIDPQMLVTAARAQLLEIAKVTSLPVNEIVLTHSDPDHVNGLPAYPAGIEIIAQDNAKGEMLAALADTEITRLSPPPELKDHLPTRTVRDTAKLTLDGVQVVLMHVAPAHTDCDLFVYLPAQKIIFTGDLLTPAAGPYPIIHLKKHGSSSGWIESLRALLALDADTYIPGHGAPQTRAGLQQALQATEQRRAQIKALFNQHKSLDEIKAALNESAPPAGAPMFPSFTETTFQELSGQ